MGAIMLIKQSIGVRPGHSIQKSYFSLFLFLCMGFLSLSHTLYGKESRQFTSQTLVYYLNIHEFAESFIEITTDPFTMESSPSTYLAGIAKLYNQSNEIVGVCSASFLSMQIDGIIYTDISNYISVGNGLIVTWFTPTTLFNLEEDSIKNSMVTECMVTASTKVGINPFYGQTFSLIVSSQDGRIYFEFTRTGMIF